MRNFPEPIPAHIGESRNIKVHVNNFRFGNLKDFNNDRVPRLILANFTTGSSDSIFKVPFWWEKSATEPAFMGKIGDRWWELNINPERLLRYGIFIVKKIITEVLCLNRIYINLLIVRFNFVSNLFRLLPKYPFRSVIVMYIHGEEVFIGIK